MQKLITKYGLAAHLAFLAMAPLFLSPVYVLWLSLLGVTWLVMEPSRIGDEMLHDARYRVFSQFMRDPLFWMLLLIVVYTGARWLNGGVGMAYDAESGSWFLRGPAVPWFPGSALAAGGSEFAVSIVLFVVVSGCRVALGKSARQAFLFILSVLTGLMALVMAYLYYDGLAIVRSLAVFEVRTPIHVGMVFGLGTLAATATMIYAFERAWRTAIFMLMLAFAANLAGLLVFAPVWTVAAFLVAEVLLFLFSFVYAKLSIGESNEFKFLVSIGLGLALAGVTAVSVVSEKPLLAKAEAVQAKKIFSPEYQSASATLSKVSQRAWKAHPWIGTGIGAFTHGIRFFAQDEDWKTIQPDQAYALNGYWQVLVERGIVGAFVMLCPLAFLLFTYFRRLVSGVCCRLPPPSAWLGLLALPVVLVLTAADCSFFYPGVPVLMAAILAISANSFPKEMSHG